MKIHIRKIKGTAHEYFAYTTTINRKASIILYFSDNIHGGVVLCAFVQMLKDYYGVSKANLILEKNEIELKNPYILDILKEELETDGNN